VPTRSTALRSALLGAVIRCAATACALLPAQLAAGLAWCGGQVEWAARPTKRRRLAANLAHATGRSPHDPDVRRLVQRNVAAGAQRAAGVLWAFARPERAAARVEIVDREWLHRLIGAGRGVVLCSPHFGSFEASAAAARTLPPGTVVAVLTDATVTAHALAPVRRRMGLTVLAAGAPPRQVARILGAGGVVVVIADLHRPGMRGHAVDFLDARVVLPGGPAAVARIGAAPLVPFAVYPAGPRRWRMELGAPIAPPTRAGGRDDERRATQQLANAFSAVIRRTPEQWDAVDPLPWRERA